MVSIAKIRADFPVLNEWVYLDNAFVGLMPKQVSEGYDRWADEWYGFDVGQPDHPRRMAGEGDDRQGDDSLIHRRLPPGDSLHDVHGQRPEHSHKRHRLGGGGQRRLPRVGAQPPRYLHDEPRRRRVPRLEAEGRQIRRHPTSRSSSTTGRDSFR